MENKNTFYVASRLENADNVRLVHRALQLHGWTLSYDWTAHGSLANSTKEAVDRAVVMETRAAGDSRLLVAILPGGRGTHAELGMALHSERCERVILVGAETQDFCLFYEHAKVMKVEMREGWLDRVFELAEDLRLTPWEKQQVECRKAAREVAYPAGSLASGSAVEERNMRRAAITKCKELGVFTSNPTEPETCLRCNYQRNDHMLALEPR